MSIGETQPSSSAILRLWRNTALFAGIADFFAVLTAGALPWSTSMVIVFGLCWLGAAALTIDYTVYFESLKRPICYLPFAFFALAVAGTLWSEATWSDRAHAINPAARLLMLPGLFYHFERSSRGTWVMVAFVASCAVNMAMSWAVAFNPTFTIKPPGSEVCGVFVKNYIDQGQEFALCAVTLIYCATLLPKERRWPWGAAAITLALCFILNMTFVVASRTTLLTLPVLLAAIAFRCLNWRAALSLSVVAVLLSVAMVQSPRMCPTFDTTRDYERYKDDNAETSTGLRVEFWKKSLQFFHEAPVVGHGTGSIRDLFQKAAIGKSGAEAVVTRNPHNQTLYVAVQWGTLGVLLLYAMWLSHFLLFREGGWAAGIGATIVLQNVISSLFNSHLFDFTEGWIYVLGVGIAGGMQLRSQHQARQAKEGTSA
ncbi:O-antigen ligase family protein [Bradyrhizobium sp.]|uniref:O-antigen ligase family protein n=1 Tax=Bradyrhizobium sp. TaxID=376 RepID=UPI001DA6973C|nr:O-antigen ligase family protein [Bradyrhizobium sp.]MBI5320791.1 O-antigen ligase family protein [Bradyrhizobium sp.]